MSEARYVLGVEIFRNHSKKLLDLIQEAYINKILERFQMHYSKLVDTPVEKGITLSLNKCLKIDKEKERLSNVPYVSVIRSLIYGMLYTRRDICFAANLATRY